MIWISDIRALQQGRTKRIRDQHYGSKGESVIRKEVRGKDFSHPSPCLQVPLYQLHRKSQVHDSALSSSPAIL